MKIPMILVVALSAMMAASCNNLVPGGGETPLSSAESSIQDSSSSVSSVTDSSSSVSSAATSLPLIWAESFSGADSTDIGSPVWLEEIYIYETDVRISNNSLLFIGTTNSSGSLVVPSIKMPDFEITNFCLEFTIKYYYPNSEIHFNFLSLSDSAQLIFNFNNIFAQKIFSVTSNNLTLASNNYIPSTGQTYLCRISRINDLLTYSLSNISIPQDKNELLYQGPLPGLYNRLTVFAGSFDTNATVSPVFIDNLKLFAR